VQADRRPLPAGAARYLPRVLDAMLAAAADGARYVRSRAADLATLEWTAKTPTDFVSEVDTGAEERIRARLVSATIEPALDRDVRVLAEESSPGTEPGPGITYVVDPLDGTTNFLHGYPEYAVSIAALIDGVLAAGVIHNVPTGELFTAVVGQGAHRNGERISVSRIADPARALIGTGLPFKHPEHIAPYLRHLPAILAGTAGVRRAGSAALDLADVACGRFDAFWELRLAPWDVAAGMLLVREAGGVVTDLAGDDASVADGPIVAGNPAMHRWLLDIVGGARADR
jgi:myo-inositol-1(or 4)-monophosphatase